jgi:hypothetical protein
VGLKIVALASSSGARLRRCILHKIIPLTFMVEVIFLVIYVEGGIGHQDRELDDGMECVAGYIGPNGQSLFEFLGDGWFS